MTAQLRVAVLDDYQGVAESMAEWGRLGPAVVPHFFREHIAAGELASVLEPFQVVVAMRERAAFPRAVLRELGNLRLLVTTGMRNSAIDMAAAAEQGVTVCGTRGLPWSTAELTWALILGLVRGVAQDDASIRAGGWQERVSGSLHGRTLGVVGLGRQGARVARIGAAFEMRILAWSPNLTSERARELGAERVDRSELFAMSDVVSVHLVLSDRTAAIIKETDFRGMKQGAFFVNTARAGLVDPEGLRHALERGWIAGVGLDVFDEEPLPRDHWLRSAPRTLLTPHMGYVSKENYSVFYQDAVEDIAAFLVGSPVRVL